ncbi:fasciclin domain-containing protein [Thioclava kandeliae]|uniref:Fasciclin domain-containing protein n=1 Tax=Thioclava kandeliae TaxID=3070818 RepID=A0ABV1SEE3_9RHOB
MSIKTTALATAAALALFAPAAFADHHTGEKPIADAAAASDDFKTLAAAVDAAGLTETLNGDGPFTVFAPTDEAFAALPAGTVDTLLEPANKAKLTSILTCHVVDKEVMSAALTKMIDDNNGTAEIPTLGDCTLQAMVKDGKVMIEDPAGDMVEVTKADIEESNGVIHAIDGVLMPASS